MAGLAYAMLNSLSLNNITLHTGSGDVVMDYEGAVVVKKASGAATQVTLPPNAADNLGGTFRWVIDGKGDAATNNITVVADSGNIIGAASYVISEDYGAVCFFYPNGGTEWLVAGAFNLVSTAELAFLNGVTAGTAAASKALVADASVNLTGVGRLGLNGLRYGDIATINAAGSVIGNATAITNRISIVDGADDTKGVVLPATVAGDEYFVYNTAATAGLKIYPPVNSDINDGSANAAITIEGKTRAHFIALDSTTWSCAFTANA